MAFERRQGAFMMQKSQQLVTMCLFCPEPGCGKPMMDKSHLQDHLLDVHDIKRFRCLWSECNASYDDFEPLGQHIRRTHGRTGRWKCPAQDLKNGQLVGCEKVFRSHNKLHRHLYHHHSKGIFRCAHPGCAYGPINNRNSVYSHYRREHRPIGYNDPFAVATEDEVDRNNPCAICIRPMTRFSQNRKLPNCPHVFHLRCLTRWMRANRTCPSCRQGF